MVFTGLVFPRLLLGAVVTAAFTDVFVHAVTYGFIEFSFA